MDTTTIMFKEQPPEQILQAWQLLRTIVLDRAVNSEAVDAWYNAVLEVRRIQARLTNWMMRVGIILANKWHAAIASKTSSNAIAQ